MEADFNFFNGRRTQFFFNVRQLEKDSTKNNKDKNNVLMRIDPPRIIQQKSIKIKIKIVAPLRVT